MRYDEGMHQLKLITTVALVTAVIGTAPVAHAETAVGPKLAVEHTAVGKQRYVADLVAPLPYALFGGLFMVEAEAARDELDLTNDAAASGAKPADVTTSARVGTIGLRYLPHPKEGAPRFFVSAARYGGFGAKEPASPMTELTLGSRLDGDDMPLGLRLKPSPADEAHSSIYVRARLYPGFTRWFGALGHELQLHGGFFADVVVPERLLLGYEGAGRNVAFYAGVRREDRAYPIAKLDDAKSLWTDGYALRALIGARHRLSGITYAALEGGYEQTSLAVLDAHGETRGERHVARGAYARLALEARVGLPP